MLVQSLNQDTEAFQGDLSFFYLLLSLTGILRELLLSWTKNGVFSILYSYLFMKYSDSCWNGSLSRRYLHLELRVCHSHLEFPLCALLFIASCYFCNIFFRNFIQHFIFSRQLGQKNDMLGEQTQPDQNRGLSKNCPSICLSWVQILTGTLIFK